MSGEIWLGQAACLAAAACWATAVTLFRDPVARHGAWTVNLAKNCIAAVLLGFTALVAGQGPALLAAPAWAVGLVAASGLVGMTLGDTALFAAVPRLGVHRTLLVQTLAPVVTAVLAIAFYGERPTALRLLGAAVVLAGVALVVAPPRRRAADVAGAGEAAVRAPHRPVDPTGLLFAALAAAGQGTGVVLAKAGMDHVPVLLASAVRLVTAAVGVMLVLAAWGRLRQAGRVLAAPGNLLRLAGPTLIGTYLAILLMMGGIAWAPASVASVLLSTSPIFSLFIDARVSGEPITLRAVAGTLLAVGGVAVLTVAG